MKITSSEIKQTLALKHSDDFFICEVKTGSTWFNSDLHIIDAWAMKKSWTKPLITAYEIKTSRGDFIKDEKWQHYLEYCHSFYFICPKDLIRIDEMGKEAGLIYVYPNSKYLKTIKKAPYRDIEFKQDLFIYILMNKLDSDRYPFHKNKQEFIKDWIKNKTIDYELGRQFSSKLTEKLIELNTQVEIYKKDAVEYKKVQELLRKYNIYAWDVIEALTKVFEKKTKIESKQNIVDLLHNSISNLTKIKENLIIEND